MKVLFFAQSRQATGCESHVLSTDVPINQNEFWTLLIRAFPTLAAQYKTTRLARDETYLNGDELLHPNDEIAIIPPVSGG